MTVTERDLLVLLSLRRYKFLITSQIRDLCFPTDKDASVARERLRKLEAAGFAMRRRAQVANPFNTSTMPVWLPTEQGCCVLATRMQDMSLLLDQPPSTAAWQNFAHYVQVSELFIRIDRAFANQKNVILHDRFLEHDQVNPDAPAPSDRYKLNTIVAEQPRRIVCAPDAAFEIQVGPYRRAYYVELERGLDGGSPQRIAAKKTPGVAGLFETQKFKSHFPEAQDMRVLAVVPNAAWRESLRNAVRPKKGNELWLFAALDELHEDTFLHGDIIYTCTDGPRPLVRPEGSPSPQSQPGAMTGGSVR